MQFKNYDFNNWLDKRRRKLNKAQDIQMEEQKPFVCKADGCTMSFTNEDHLNVHTKKHAMVLHLSLSNKSSHFVGMYIDVDHKNVMISKCLNPKQNRFASRSNTNANETYKEL